MPGAPRPTAPRLDSAGVPRRLFARAGGASLVNPLGHGQILDPARTGEPQGLAIINEQQRLDAAEYVRGTLDTDARVGLERALLTDRKLAREKKGSGLSLLAGKIGVRSFVIRNRVWLEASETAVDIRFCIKMIIKKLNLLISHRQYQHQRVPPPPSH